MKHILRACCIALVTVLITNTLILARPLVTQAYGGNPNITSNQATVINKTTHFSQFDNTLDVAPCAIGNCYYMIGGDETGSTISVAKINAAGTFDWLKTFSNNLDTPILIDSPAGLLVKGDAYSGTSLDGFTSPSQSQMSLLLDHNTGNILQSNSILNSALTAAVGYGTNIFTSNYGNDEYSGTAYGNFIYSYREHGVNTGQSSFGVIEKFDVTNGSVQRFYHTNSMACGTSLNKITGLTVDTSGSIYIAGASGVNPGCSVFNINGVVIPINVSTNDANFIAKFNSVLTSTDWVHYNNNGLYFLDDLSIGSNIVSAVSTENSYTPTLLDATTGANIGTTHIFPQGGFTNSTEIIQGKLYFLIDIYEDSTDLCLDSVCAVAPDPGSGNQYALFQATLTTNGFVANSVTTIGASNDYMEPMHLDHSYNNSLYLVDVGSLPNDGPPDIPISQALLLSGLTVPANAYFVARLVPPLIVTPSCADNTTNTSQQVDVCLDVTAGALTIYAGDNSNNNDVCTKTDIATTAIISVNSSNQAESMLTCSDQEDSAVFNSLSVTSTRQNTITVIDDIIFEDLRGLASSSYTLTANVSHLTSNTSTISLGSNPDNATNDLDPNAPVGLDIGKIFVVIDPSAGAIHPLRPGTAIAEGISQYTTGTLVSALDPNQVTTLLSTSSPVSPGRIDLDGVVLKYRIPAFPVQQTYTSVMTITVV
jgi:hypothetical protein